MAETLKEPHSIAIIGGTGDLGYGLAWRWAKAGYKIIIGSRVEEKAVKAAEQLRDVLSSVQVEGKENRAAAEAADVVCMTVPYANAQSTLETIKPALTGKILVDVTVPLRPPKVARVQLPESDSAAVAAQEFLGDEVTVVSAFQNVGAEHLPEDYEVDCDVLVTGDNVEAREIVLKLVEAAGMRGWHAGPLANSAAVEALTSVLISINSRYKIRGSGIRITGTPGSAAKGD